MAAVCCYGKENAGALYACGHTFAVFEKESEGTVNTLRKLERLVFHNLTLWRPGQSFGWGYGMQTAMHLSSRRTTGSEKSNCLSTLPKARLKMIEYAFLGIIISKTDLSNSVAGVVREGKL